MDAGRFQQLDDILAISKKMLDHAKENQWDLVAELESDRRKKVERCFQHVTSDQDASAVAAAIRKILQLNKEISELGSAHRKALGADLSTNKVGRAARAAYLGCRGEQSRAP